MCDNPEQASHYHILGPKLGVSPLTLVSGVEGIKWVSGIKDICVLWRNAVVNVPVPWLGREAKPVDPRHYTEKKRDIHHLDFSFLDAEMDV